MGRAYTFTSTCCSLLCVSHKSTTEIHSFITSDDFCVRDDFNRPRKSGKGSHKCEHCHRLSHKIDRCYALHGCPP